MRPLLEIERLSIELSGAGEPRAVVCDASLRLGPGEIAAVVGESGSGKTLLTRSIVGLLPPFARVSADTLRFAGQDLLKLDAEQLRKLRGMGVAFVFQEPLSSLNPTVRVGVQLTEGLRTHLRISRAKADARALRMLERVQIRDPSQCMSCYPHQLSGGMRQRVMIAAALIMKPQLLIADEPTTALDALVQREVLELMREAAAEIGSALLMVTHDLSVVRGLADTVHVMHRGRLVESGPTAQVFAAPMHECTRQLVQATTTRLPAFTPPAVRDQPSLQVEAISVSYPQPRWALRRSGSTLSRASSSALCDVSFQLQPGEILAVIGESGSGKTTLGRAIAGLQPLESGEIRLGARVLSQVAPAERGIQYVFQDPWAALDPRMRVGDIVAEGLQLKRDVSADERRRRCIRSLEQVGLSAALCERYPHELSGGQRQRVNIARAIVVEPRFLVADEPVSALDLTVQRQILQLLLELRRAQAFGCLLVSHDLRAVSQIADRVCVLYRGRMVEIGDCEQVFDSPTHDYTRQLLSSTRNEHEPCLPARTARCEAGTGAAL